MIVILGLVILLAAVVIGVAGVWQRRQRACADPWVRGVRLSRDRIHRHVVPVRHRGRGGRLVRAVAAAGRRAPHLPARPRGPPRAQAVPPRDRRGQPGPRRPDRPARHRPRLHRQHLGNGAPRGRPPPQPRRRRTSRIAAWPARPRRPCRSARPGRMTHEEVASHGSLCQ